MCIRDRTVYIGLFGQLAQQHFGHGLYLKHMLCALAVAELDNMTEDADHDMAVFLVPIDLVGDNVHQPLLVGVEMCIRDRICAFTWSTASAIRCSARIV